LYTLLRSYLDKKYIFLQSQSVIRLVIQNQICKISETEWLFYIYPFSYPKSDMQNFLNRVTILPVKLFYRKKSTALNSSAHTVCGVYD